MEIKMYFKSKLALDRIAHLKKHSGYSVEFCTLNCACGESWGARIMDENLITVEKLYLCPGCYYGVPFVARGE